MMIWNKVPKDKIATVVKLPVKVGDKKVKRIFLLFPYYNKADNKYYWLGFVNMEYEYRMNYLMGPLIPVIVDMPQWERIGIKSCIKSK